MRRSMVTMNIENIERQVIGQQPEEEDLTPVFSVKLKNPAFYSALMQSQHVATKSDLLKEALKVRAALSKRRYVKFLFHIQSVINHIDSLPDPSFEEAFDVVHSE